LLLLAGRPAGLGLRPASGRLRECAGMSSTVTVRSKMIDVDVLLLRAFLPKETN
jgi:hypothetical protein